MEKKGISSGKKLRGVNFHEMSEAPTRDAEKWAAKMSVKGQPRKQDNKSWPK